LKRGKAPVKKARGGPLKRFPKGRRKKEGNISGGRRKRRSKGRNRKRAYGKKSLSNFLKKVRGNHVE